VAQLPVLRRYAHKLTRNREQALDLVQDTCERALRFRRLFRDGTCLRAWVLFLDMAKRLTENELSDFSRLWHDGCGRTIIETQDVDGNHSPEI
jgi:DNA-directed RNA polymerase specialized sigma24 family protein